MSGLLPAEQNLAGWQTSWFIFSAYALVISVLFILLFKSPKGKLNKTDVKELESETNVAPGGETNI